MPALIITPPVGEAYPHYLIDTETRIGSGEGCHLTILDECVAQYHCLLVGHEGRWRLTDKSGDGLQLDEKKVWQCPKPEGWNGPVPAEPRSGASE